MSKKTQSEQIKLYAVIALSVVAAVMAYSRFAGKSPPSAPPTESGPAPDVYEVLALPGWMSSNPPPMAVDALPYTPPRRDIFAPMAETPAQTEVPAKTEAPAATTETRAKTEGLNVPPVDRSRPHLGGIIRGAKESQAIIDGKIVRTGDRVGKYTVVVIGQRGVILTSPTERLVLMVGE